MDEGALFELEDEVGRVTVRLVLRDGVAPRLARHLVLELRRGDGDPIEREGHVEGIAVL